MPFLDTPIDGLKCFEPRIFEDDRGYFYESYNENTFREAGITAHWVQDNQAYSQRGALRGLHYQTGPMAQAKLVRVLHGAVLDVAVDLREGSPTYGHWYSLLLSGSNHCQLYIPRGFAHGYSVLSETAIFCYKCDNFYSKLHEGGIRFDDPSLAIDWRLGDTSPLVSEKDALLPLFGRHAPAG